MTKPIVAITIGQSHYPRMFSQHAWDVLDSFAQVVHHSEDEPADKEALITLLRAVDGCITSWGVAQFDEDVMAAAPRLRAMAHMGSSVKRFVSPAFWARDMHLTSAGITLARDVAETTLGLMIVGQKRIWPLGQHVREGGWRDSPVWEKWFSRELIRKNVGIIGASNVGRHLIELLKPFEVNVLLYDPFISEEAADELGATRMPLDDLLQACDVLSLCAPGNEATYKMINAERLAMMKDDTLIVNTARGTLIDEGALIVELQKGRFFAFLDVTDPEPPAADSPLRQLPNVVVTPHIAGCIDNCNRMGELAVGDSGDFSPANQPFTKLHQKYLRGLLEMSTTRRLNRIFRPDGRVFIVAFDHGMIDGPAKGMEQPAETLRKIVAGGADAILTTYGMATRFAREIASLGLILRLDGGGTKLGEMGPGSQFYAVEDALRLGADAVAISAFPGAPNEESSLRTLAEVAGEAQGWGLPLMGEMVPGGFDSPDHLRTAESIAIASRVGAELGADWVKIPYAAGFEQVTAGCFVPAVILGGAKKGSEREMLVNIRAALDVGAVGVAIGRNIFQADNPTAMTAAVAALIHQDASIDEAMTILTGG